MIYSLARFSYRGIIVLEYAILKTVTKGLMPYGQG